jgi:hypothetical protein
MRVLFQDHDANRTRSCSRGCCNAGARVRRRDHDTYDDDHDHGSLALQLF